MAINNGAIDHITVNSMQAESTHHRSLSHHNYSTFELGLHKNDRQAELLQEIQESSDICVDSSEIPNGPAVQLLR